MRAAVTQLSSSGVETRFSGSPSTASEIVLVPSPHARVRRVIRRIIAARPSFRPRPRTPSRCVPAGCWRHIVVSSRIPHLLGLLVDEASGPLRIRGSVSPTPGSPAAYQRGMRRRARRPADPARRSRWCSPSTAPSPARGARDRALSTATSGAASTAESSLRHLRRDIRHHFGRHREAFSRAACAVVRGGRAACEYARRVAGAVAPESSGAGERSLIHETAFRPSSRPRNGPPGARGRSAARAAPRLHVSAQAAHGPGAVQHRDVDLDLTCWRTPGTSHLRQRHLDQCPERAVDLRVAAGALGGGAAPVLRARASFAVRPGFGGAWVHPGQLRRAPRLDLESSSTGT